MTNLSAMTVNVSDVPIATVFALASNPAIDSLQFISGRNGSTTTITLDSDQYKVFNSHFSKIANLPAANLHINKVSGGDALVIAANTFVDSVILLDNQSINLTSASLTRDTQAHLLKITGISGADVVLTVVGNTLAGLPSLADLKSFYEVDQIEFQRGAILSYDDAKAIRDSGIKVLASPGINLVGQSVAVSELAQFYGAGFNVVIAGNLSGVAAEDAYNLAMNSAVTGITLLPGQQNITLTASEYQNIANLKAKIANLSSGNVNLTVIGLDGSNVIAAISDIAVDSVTLSTSQIISVNYSAFISNPNLGKITNLVDATVRATGVTEGQFIAAITNQNIDSVALADALLLPNAQAIRISYSEYTENLQNFTKVLNLVSAKIAVTGISNQATALAVAADANIDAIELGNGTTFSQTFTEFNSASNKLRLAKISNLKDADFTVTAVSATNALTVAAIDTVDRVVLTSSPAPVLV
jgi:hypothetical protein